VKCKSLEIVDLTTKDCSQIESVLTIMNDNESINNLSIIVDYSINEFEKIFFGEKQTPIRKISFHNLINTDFINSLDYFISIKDKLNSLDLSGNKLNKINFSKKFVKILSELKTLNVLD
jgi:hypothetical protein